MLVKLTAKTAKAKQRIRQYGDTGEVLKEEIRVGFSSERGPWLLVTAADHDSIWVHKTNDKDFTVKILDIFEL